LVSGLQHVGEDFSVSGRVQRLVSGDLGMAEEVVSQDAMMDRCPGTRRGS
jgi:hypothetical protein